MNTANVSIDRILEHIVNLYHPLAVILYGSRAVGDNTPHSDWDLYLIVDQKKDSLFGQQIAMFLDQSLDIVFVTHEVDALDIVVEFDNTLVSARVVFDPHGIGKSLLDRASKTYLSGRNLCQKDIVARREYLTKLQGRLEDHKGNPALFFMRSSQFYREAIRAWYEILHNRWQSFLSQALKEIKSADPDFHSLLETIHNSGFSETKLVATRSILEHLFQNRNTTGSLKR